MKNAAILPPEWLCKSAIYQINPRTFSSEGTLNAITSAFRFYRGNYEVTDRSAKSTPQAIRRQEIIKALNAIKNESDILCYGETAWIDTSANESIIAFKRTLNDEKIIFIGNAKNSDCEIDVKDFYCGQKIFLCNGKHIIENNILHLTPHEYVVFIK